jgi:hypothetical protein
MAPNDPAQLDHERRIRRLEEARMSVESTLATMVELERLQTARLKEHQESIVDIEQSLVAMAELERLQTARLLAHERWKTEMEQLLTEIGEKLNGLIGWADGTVHPPDPPIAPEDPAS